MEGLAGLQVVASIVQVIDVGCRVVRRLKEYHDKTNELPDVFMHISKRLPILVETLGQTNSTIEAATESTRKALTPATEECLKQIEKLEFVVETALPKTGDSSIVKTWKALASVKYESEIKQTDRVIKDYMEILSQHQISSLTVQNLNRKFLAQRFGVLVE
jgi:hypothetical protein